LSGGREFTEWSFGIALPREKLTGFGAVANRQALHARTANPGSSFPWFDLRK
jgi:hypothetical protein